MTGNSVTRTNGDQSVSNGQLRVLTVGHSNTVLSEFIDLLGLCGVQTVVDVRSSPYSRFAPRFNREALAASLAGANIEYRWAGEYLGGRPSDPTCYWSGSLPEGKADYLELVNYAEVAKRDWFLRGLARLKHLAETRVTAALCSEEDPARCHRHRLIARVLLGQGVEIQHIRGSGDLESAQRTDERINQCEAAKQLGLFEPQDIA